MTVAWKGPASSSSTGSARPYGPVGRIETAAANQATGRVVDGHLRIELALERSEATVPVTYVELSEEEEGLVLATLDPIGAMADAEAKALER